MSDFRDRRTVAYGSLTVCANGHVLTQLPACQEEELRCACGKWTLAQANYCQWCGQALYPPKAGDLR